jgi:hypothetical protein
VAGSVDLVATELTEPSAALPDRLPPEVAERWPVHAAAIAAAITAGGTELDAEHTRHVAFVVRGSTYYYGALNHSSSGREDFRQRFRSGCRLGHDTIAHLVERPLAGLTWSAYPVIGWLSNAELRAAIAGPAAGSRTPPEDADDGEALWTLERAMRRAADHQLDLLTIYW